jgi:phosphate transport system permease protein
MAGFGIGLSLVPFRFHVQGPVNFGWAFFGSTFNPPRSWGIAVFIVGSFLTAVPALFLSMAIGLGIAIASTTYLPRFLTVWLDPFVDLLAGIPSVVFGIWAYVLVAPYFGHVLNPWAATHLSFIPGFGGYPGGLAGDGLPVSIFILTLMALPITTLLIRDALRSLPRDLWESGLALGATRWETVRRVGLPHGMRGILSAGFLGFGRAFGETVAVAMILGVNAHYPMNVYDSTGTMAATMFELLDSAYGNSQFLALLAEMALVLLAITLVVNIVGRRFVSTFIGYEIAGM